MGIESLVRIKEGVVVCNVSMRVHGKVFEV